MNHFPARARRVALLAALILTTPALALGAPSAAVAAEADKSVTASSPGAIAIPDMGFADPFPSSVVVPAGHGVVTDLDVALSGLQHQCMQDLSVRLVGPTGVSATLMAEAGSCNSVLHPANLVFDDDADSTIARSDEVQLESGTYRPTDNVDYGPDFEPAVKADLSVFNGTPSSGPWSLFVYDRLGADSGEITGGWSLDIDYNDTVVPTGSILVDGGAVTTTSATTVLTLSATDPSPGSGVRQMRFSNDETSWSPLRDYATTTDWTLSDGDGTKTVWVQYADDFGNLSDPVYDTVELDTAGPTGSVVVGEGAATAASATTVLTLSATDPSPGTGVTRMRFSNDATSWSPFRAYGTTTDWTLSDGDGTKTVWVQYADDLGNLSEPTSDTIVLDRTGPTGLIVIAGGAGTTTSATTTLTLKATDLSPGTGVTRMRFSNDATTWSPFRAYDTTTDWTLSPGNATKTVWVQYADDLGNRSDPASDTIVLDTSRSVAPAPDTTAPKATKLTPGRKATEVAAKAKVSFVASEGLDAATVTNKTVKLMADGKTVKAVVTYAARTRKVTLTPARPLAASTRYVVTVAKVTDVSGNAMKKTTWLFTTR